MIDYARMHDSYTPCELRIALDRRFDLAALRVLRRTLAEAGELRHLHLDFASVASLDAAALRLLADDLTGIEGRGAGVVVRRLPAEIAAQLAHHPLRRFSADDDFGEDALFTDPDREQIGFAPSDR